MILSFKCVDTRAVYEGKPTRQFQSFRRVLMRKLLLLNDAVSLHDFKGAGNRLEACTRDRVGQHAIRVNDQYRLCFVWTSSGPENVECVDYH